MYLSACAVYKNGRAFLLVKIWKESRKNVLILGR